MKPFSLPGLSTGAESGTQSKKMMQRVSTLLHLVLLARNADGFLTLPRSFLSYASLHSSNSDSELPPNKDYKSPLSDDGNISFLGSLKKSVDNFREEATAGSEVNVPTTQDSTELPLSFEDAVGRAATLCAQGIQRGGLSKLRIDFDTSIGDMTYTSLKNTLPMTKQLSVELGESFVHFIHMDFHFIQMDFHFIHMDFCVYLFTSRRTFTRPFLFNAILTFIT